ncbi:phage antirepressor KilAC domain-containing protein [Clostridium culturomicium]|uniref:phage antirepressor KilAC domain-containing protein n=1 Tax=Clostridium culturomicium TaxID=1499683 RepID=UPI00058EEA97|nr:phage antirepressor KilAC domain-containing protein [Clostridium culturomicium]
MNDLIKVTTTGEDITLSARELHEFLEINSNFTTWFKRMCEYGFTEQTDFIPILEESNGGRPGTDFEIKLDMAKEIAMIQRSEKGKQARQYFIQVEKDWNSPDKIMERALIIARARVEKLTLETKQQKQIIGELKPKADYTDTILKNKGLVTITQIAKDYGMSGQAFNKLLHELGVQYKQSDQWLLYSEHHSKGYTHSETVPITRSNGTPDVKMVTKWTQKGRLFLYDLLKQHEILPTIEREE